MVRSGREVEVLAVELKATTVGFLARAVRWFSEQRIICLWVLSGNGSAYRSGDWRKAGQSLPLKPTNTKPYMPQTNGKAERYGLRPTSSPSKLLWWNGTTSSPTRHRRNATAGYPAIWGSNGHRCQMALGGLSPQPCLQRLLIAE
jgi:transposase InsO family protein